MRCIHSGYFQVIVSLPPGYHQYKFIVDGEWRHDETQPFMPDPLGNVNNWLFVQRRRVDPPAPCLGVGTGRQGSLKAPLSLSRLLFSIRRDEHVQTGHYPHGVQTTPPGTPLMPQGTAGAVASPLALVRSSPPLCRRFQCLTGAERRAHPMQQGGSAAAGMVSPVPLQPAPSGQSDVEFLDSGASIAAISSMSMPSGDEPAYSRKKIRDFLLSHTAYELIPESGKVILLDTLLPIRQAFHALSEQGISSAPLWDSQERTIVGMVSASDFIDTLSRLRNSVSQAGGNPMSEDEMDEHSIRELREQFAAEGALLPLQPPGVHLFPFPLGRQCCFGR